MRRKRARALFGVTIVEYSTVYVGAEQAARQVAVAHARGTTREPPSVASTTLHAYITAHSDSRSLGAIHRERCVSHKCGS